MTAASVERITNPGRSIRHFSAFQPSAVAGEQRMAQKHSMLREQQQTSSRTFLVKAHSAWLLCALVSAVRQIFRRQIS